MEQNEELLLEMAQFGKIDGKPIRVYSDDHNPPHFHFGNVQILIGEVIPKNVTELRERIMNKADNSKVTDKELQALLKILHSTYKAMPIGDTYTMIQTIWAVYHSEEQNRNVVTD